MKKVAWNFTPTEEQYDKLMSLQNDPEFIDIKFEGNRPDDRG